MTPNDLKSMFCPQLEYDGLSWPGDGLLPPLPATLLRLGGMFLHLGLIMPVIGFQEVCRKKTDHVSPGMGFRKSKLQCIQPEPTELVFRNYYRLRVMRDVD